MSPRRLIFFLLVFISARSFFCQVPQEELVLWLSAGKNVELKNDSVISWGDARNNSLRAICNTPQKPVLQNASANGLPCITFNGQNTGLQTTQQFTTFDKKRGSIFAVMRVRGRGLRSSAGIGNIVSSYHGSGLCWQFCAGPTGYTFYDGIGGVGVSMEKTSTAEWCAIGLVRANDSTMNFYRNGRYLSTVAINTLQPQTNTLKIGYNGMQAFGPEDISEVLNGDIAEILIYNTSFPEEQVLKIQRDLCKKYTIDVLPEPFHKTWWFYLLIGVLVVLFILLLQKIVQTRKMKKQLIQLKLEQEIAQERIRISRDMHDELGSGLSKIRLMSELINSSKNKEQLNERLKTISETSGQLVDNMRDLIWVLHPENNTLYSLVARIREYASDYLEDFSIELKTDITENIPSVKISSEAGRNIYMIAKESLQNIIKHSGATKVHLRISFDQVFIMEIKDNGKGFDASSEKNGNGLRNLKTRSEEIKGIIQIESSPKGTSVLFEIENKNLLK